MSVPQISCKDKPQAMPCFKAAMHKLPQLSQNACCKDAAQASKQQVKGTRGTGNFAWFMRRRRRRPNQAAGPPRLQRRALRIALAPVSSARVHRLARSQPYQRCF